MLQCYGSVVAVDALHIIYILLEQHGTPATHTHAGKHRKRLASSSSRILVSRAEYQYIN